jgi:mono/diheme cytochrome c family protein
MQHVAKTVRRVVLGIAIVAGVGGSIAALRQRPQWPTNAGWDARFVSPEPPKVQAPQNTLQLVPAHLLKATPAGVSAGFEPPDPAQMERGRKVYFSSCFACHLATGDGVAGIFPPLARSDYLLADRERAITITVKGLTGPITVNGKPYNNFMPPQPLTDDQVADVMTYVLNSWGNQAAAVTPLEVRRVLGER